MPADCNLFIPVSWGELIDKISILRIKSERMRVPEKLRNVRAELLALIATRDQAAPPDPAVEALAAELHGINERLWDLEDRMRALDRAGCHDAGFVETARVIRHLNDRRSRIKYEINRATKSRLVEEKHYSSDDESFEGDVDVDAVAQSKKAAGS